MATRHIDLGNITIGIGESPSNFNLAVVSTDPKGGSGALNTSVLKELGYRPDSVLRALDLKKGYDWIGGDIPVLFIVTTGQGSTRRSLAENLEAGLSAYADTVTGKNIWIPLLGTGSGKLKLLSSFDIIFPILERRKDSRFMISLPEGNQGEKAFESINARFEGDFIPTEKKTEADEPHGNDGSVSAPDFSAGRALREKFGKSDFYFASFFLNDKDVGREFLDNARWGYGPDFRPDRVDGVKANDIFLLKGPGVRKPDAAGAFLEVRAIGVVASTYDRGYFQMAWSAFDELLYFDKFLREYNDPLVPIRETDLAEILTELMEHRTGLENDIRALLPRDNIPFHDDKAVDNDQLGREPVAKAFVNLLKQDVFTKDFNYSFMVHLQGEWGAGKSTFLKLIKKHLRGSVDPQWIVVDYNAWQNQHIDPPWWTLLDKVYTETLKQMPFWPRLKLILSERARRIQEYSYWRNIVALLLMVAMIILLIWKREWVARIFESVIDKGQKGVGERIEDLLKMITAVATFIGGTFGVIRLITNVFFAKSPDQIKSFVMRASDPQKKIKNHFKKLVSNINGEKRRKIKNRNSPKSSEVQLSRKRQLAIFIDDIDRCNKEFIIRLLEGIQTLFKENRVLFIIAGDKNWITRSFGETYSDFAEDPASKTKLGEFFVEKAFQLALRLPNISKLALENYWNYILGKRTERENVIKLDEVDPETKDKIQLYLTSLREGMESSEIIKGVQAEFNLDMDAAASALIDSRNADGGRFNHHLSDFYSYVNTNPRSIKRLANSYTMIRSTLIAEQVDVEEKTLLWWLILEDLCRPLSHVVPTARNLDDFHETILQTTEPKHRRKCIEVFNDYVRNAPDHNRLLTDIKALKGHGDYSENEALG